MTPDSALLLRYARRGDEAAFAEVVRRHVNMVYASAVRMLNGDAALAEDVTQTVFVDMALKAKQLGRYESVVGWLHISVRFAASSAIRAEQRRRVHEQEAGAMSDPMSTSPEIHWMHVRPFIDEAVGQLRDLERNALLLRYFEDKSHREVGLALGLSENAARMRIERGLEKLRRHFARHGVKTTVALLAATLSAQAASVSAPPAFAARVATQSLLQLAKLKAAGGLAAKAGMQKSAMAKAVALFAGMTAVTAGGLVLLLPPQKAAPSPARAPATTLKTPATAATVPAPKPLTEISPARLAPVAAVVTAVLPVTTAAADLLAANDAPNPAQAATGLANAPDGPHDSPAANSAPQNLSNRENPSAPSAHAPVEWEVGDRRTDFMRLQLPRVSANLAAQPASAFAWDAVGAFSENRAQVARATEQGAGPMRWGFIDNTGKVVVAPQWDAVEPFSGGRAAVALAQNAQNMQWGFIDPMGAVISAPQWDAVEPFSSGLSAVSRLNQPVSYNGPAAREKWGFINPDGKVVVTPQFDAIQGWGGYYRTWEGGHWVEHGGWANFDGTSSGVTGPGTYLGWNDGGWKSAQRTVSDWDNYFDQLKLTASAAPPAVLPAVHTDFTRRSPYDGDYAWSAAQYINNYRPAARQAFSDGLLGVGMNQNGSLKWGFMNAAGRVVVPPKWDGVLPFSEGLALVKAMVAPSPASIPGTGLNLAATSSAAPSPPSAQYGYIDQNGRLVIGLAEGFAGSFSEGLAARTITITQGEEPHRITQILASGYIDRAGTMVITAHGAWEAAGPFSEGLAAVRTPGGLGYIDKTGKLVIAGNWDAALPFSEGVAVVALHSRTNSAYQFGYINALGKALFPLKFGANRGDVMANSEKGPVIEHLPPPFTDGLALVNLTYGGKNNQAAYLDNSGAIIAEWPLDRAHAPLPYVDWTWGFSNGYAAVGLPVMEQKPATNVHPAALFFNRRLPTGNSESVVKWGFMDRAGNMLPAPGP